MSKHLATVLCFLKKYFNKLFLSFFCFSLVSLIGISLLSIPFDNYLSTSITKKITQEAEKSAYGYGLNSVEMIKKENADYYIYNDNDLQNFQMRNQTVKGIKSYIFSCYKPYSNYSPFNFNDKNGNLVKCTSLSYESKYDGKSFYFEMPLLYGKITRSSEKKDIVITSKLAEKITDDPQLLIGKNINGTTIGYTGSSNENLKVVAILDSNNKLGLFLEKVFGENIIFSSDYLSFQMSGACFFCSSINKEENQKMVDFVLKKYKYSLVTSASSQAGYSPNYQFYESKNGEFEINDLNETLNKLVTFYSGFTPYIFMIIGILIILLSNICTFSLLLANIRNNCTNKSSIFTIWFAVSFALVLYSLIYRFLHITTIVTKVQIIETSRSKATFIIIGYLLTILIYSILLINEQHKLKIKQLN